MQKTGNLGWNQENPSKTIAQIDETIANKLNSLLTLRGWILHAVDGWWW